MKNKRLILTGIVILTASFLIGFFGGFGGVAYSFSSLSEAEVRGIDAVGNGITFALIATVVGLVGSLAGICLVVVDSSGCRVLPISNRIFHAGLLETAKP